MSATGFDVFDKTLQTTDLRALWMSAEERVVPPLEQGELGRYRA